MKYEYDYRTRSHELDRHHALKPTQLVQYLQETAEHQIHDQDRDYLELYHVERKAYIISRMSVEIDHPIERFAEITARTWIQEGRGATFPRSYDLVWKGDVFARAESTWAMVDVDTRKLIRFKDYDVSSYPVDEAPKLRIPTRFRIPAELSFREAGTIPVTLTKTDINRHMNNAMYLNDLFDLLPDADDLFLTSLNIRYIHEGAFGKNIKAFLAETSGDPLIDPAAERLFWFKTEVDGNANIEAVFGARRYGA